MVSFKRIAIRHVADRGGATAAIPFSLSLQPGLARRLFLLLLTLALVFAALSPAKALESSYYRNQNVGGIGTDSYYWVNGYKGSGLWIDVTHNTNAYHGWYREDDYSRSRSWIDGSYVYFAKLRWDIYPKKYTVYPNEHPTVYFFNINNSSHGGNYLFTPAQGDTHASITGGGRKPLKLHDALITIEGSTEQNRYTATFDNVDLPGEYTRLQVIDYDRVNFRGSSLEVTEQLRLWGHAIVDWSGEKNALGDYPHLQAPEIYGDSGTVLYMDLWDESNLRGIASITGKTRAFKVHLRGAANETFTLPYINTADVFVDSGTMRFSRLPAAINLTIERPGEAIVSPQMRFSGLHVDGELNVHDRLYTDSLSGYGNIRLSGNTDFFWPQSNNLPNFTDFTGNIYLNDQTLTVSDPALLGRTSTIFGRGQIAITTPANRQHLLNTNFYSDARYPTGSRELVLATQGAGTLTLAPYKESRGTELTLHKRGPGELVLSGGSYAYKALNVDEGRLTLTDGVSLDMTSLNSSGRSELNIGGDALLQGNLAVNGSRFSLEGGLHVTRNASFGSSTDFDYRGGLLTTQGRLDLGSSTFSANLPHPGVFVVADYASLGSRFGNAPLNDQNVTSYVQIQNEATRSPAFLSYTPNNQAKLVAGSGYNLLYYAGGWIAGQGGWNGEPIINNWQNMSGQLCPWDNSKISAAIFDHAYSYAPVFHISVANHVRANMISFLDGGWLITGNNNDFVNHNIILHPFASDPNSRFYFTVLNSQANPRLQVAAPRLELPVQVSAPSVPLWKTGAGDLVLAADASATVPGGYRPERVFIREGRLILEHNAALKDALITIDPESVLTLNWKTSGTGNELLNTLAGYGALDVQADTTITSANPDFFGDVSVDVAASLAVADFEALGKEPGLANIAMGRHAFLTLAYDNADTPLPRGIDGEGGVTVAAGAAARLASGNTYQGGTTVANAATLVLEGTDEEQAFSAAGSGAITLDDATLRLEDGGILQNALGGTSGSTLQLGGMHTFTLEDANLRSGAFGGAVAVENSLGVFALKADSARGATLAPSFASIGGAGNLLLEGAGVTFDFTGSSNNSYAGETVLGEETGLKLSGDYTSGQIGAGEIALQGKDSTLLLEMSGGGTNIFANDLSGVGELALNGQTYHLTGDNFLLGGGISIPGTLLVAAQSEVGQARLLLDDGATLETQADSLENTIELAGGNATLATTQDLLLSGAITDSGENGKSGGLIKSGSGELTLTFSNHDYRGPTVITDGTLRLKDSTLAGSGAVTVESGATLAGWGGVAGDTLLRSGGGLLADGLLSFSGQEDASTTNLTLAGGSALTFANGGWLDVSGALDWNAAETTNTINLDSLGVYVLARYGSTTLANGAVDKSHYTVNYEGADIIANPNYRLELVNYGAQKDVLFLALPTGQKVEFWNGDGGLWNTNGTTNWNSRYDAAGLTETWASDSRIAVFGTDASAPGDVTVQGDVAASGLFFLSSGWNVTGGTIGLLDLDPFVAGNLAVLSGQEGDIFINATLADGTSGTGGVGLQKSGPGTITLNAANTYTGETLVSAGTLALGDSNAAGRNPTITVEEDATLRLAYAEPSRGLPQTVTGQGMLDISGNVLLNKANTHSGGTGITDGALHLAHADALGTGDLFFRNGLLSLRDGLAVQNDVSLDGAFNIVTVPGGEVVTLSGDIRGDGMYKIGAGTLTLAGNSVFTGNLEVEQGKLVAGSDTAFGYSTVQMAHGATLGFSGSRVLENAFSLNGAALFEATSADYATLDGVIHGSGDLVKIGDGTLTLSGANEYTGWTDVLEGTLALDAAGGRISDRLSLRDGATFDTGGNEIDIAELSAHWQSFYTGDLHTGDGAMLFTLPASVRPHGAEILHIDGRAEIGNSLVALDLGGRDRKDLLPGHVLTLIRTGDGIHGLPRNKVAIGRLGITRVYEADLWTDTHNLYAGVTHLGASPESKALSEGFLAGLALINQGGDMVAGQGMHQARAAALGSAQESEGVNLAGFSAVAGSWSRYASGSHIDMNSVSLIAGLAAGLGEADFAPGSGIHSLTLGAFFEYGDGSYDTHNSFRNTASVDGDGDTRHAGGGVLGRMEFAAGGPTRRNGGQNLVYVEASGRMGKAYTGYGSADLRDSHTGITGNYDSSSLYYGFHLGVGTLWNVSEKASFDLHAKYFQTRQEGDSVTLSNGDPVTFKDADSRRLRLGARFAYAVNEYVSPYVGAAYEHEFDGKAAATTYGYAIEAPTLRGDTGIGEIGLSFKPSLATPLSFDLGLQGYTGKRQGVTGSIQAKLEF